MTYTIMLGVKPYYYLLTNTLEISNTQDIIISYLCGPWWTIAHVANPGILQRPDGEEFMQRALKRRDCRYATLTARCRATQASIVCL